MDGWMDATLTCSGPGSDPGREYQVTPKWIRSQKPQKNQRTFPRTRFVTSRESNRRISAGESHVFITTFDVKPSAFICNQRHVSKVRLVFVLSCNNPADHCRIPVRHGAPHPIIIQMLKLTLAHKAAKTHRSPFFKTFDFSRSGSISG